MTHPFAIMPYEVFLDERLTKIELRVLGAILTFRNRDTNLARPTRDQIGERCGYGVVTISKATSSLVEKGWLEKAGKGGNGVATCYRFKVPDLFQTVSEPETVSEPATVAGSETVAEPATVPGSGSKRCPNRTLNGVRTGNTNRPYRPYRPEREGAREAELPDGVPREAWETFVEHRERMGRPLNDLASRTIWKRLLELPGEVRAPALESAVVRGLREPCYDARAPTGQATASEKPRTALQRAEEAYRREWGETEPTETATDDTPLPGAHAGALPGSRTGGG